MNQVRKIVKKLIPEKLFRQIEPYGHLVEAIVANIIYGFPSRGMHIIGVTGTNGKTTTSFIIHKMLAEAGYDVALMTTVAYGLGDNIQPQVAHMTTASAPLLQKRLREMKRQGAKWVVLETTSHALAQHRVWGIPYEIAVMTNITHEHLDYHGTFDAYLAAKQRLFRIANKHGRRFGVVNADDPDAQYFTSCVPDSISYGIRAGQLTADKIKLQPDGASYRASIGSDHYDIVTSLPGEFNVYNTMAAVSVGRKLGLTKSQIEQGIAALKTVEGRMNIIDEGQEYNVIVDFAHTPDAFERLLVDVRKSTKGKLVAVFGSAGRRDEAKRAIQGEIAGKYCDEVVLTEEDDRDIDGLSILNQIAEGSEKSGKVRDKDLFLIGDRTEAIEFAMSRVSSSQDTVILLGKGHEKTIERADGEHSWDESATARQAIAKTLK